MGANGRTLACLFNRLRAAPVLSCVSSRCKSRRQAVFLSMPASVPPLATKGDTTMADAPRLQRLIGSLARSAGTIVFGMEDGTVSIFGLVFGVAATTSSSKVVLIAGASGAAAAVSMMAGAYLDVETTRDALAAKRSSLQSDLALDQEAASLPAQLAAAGLTPGQSVALSNAVQHD